MKIVRNSLVVGALLAVVLVGGLLWLLTPPNITPPPKQDHLITNVIIWNPGEPARAHQTIAIKDGLILEIRDTRPDDPESICPECYVVPGLIDAHVHTPPKLAIGNQKLFSLLYLQYLSLIHI